jgi:ubiquinone/menaquinone biosynthesis C-methylase UbiE
MKGLQKADEENMPLRMHKHKREAGSKIALRRLSGLLLLAGVMLFVSISLPAQSLSARDRDHQPERVMDAVGLQPGMVVGEVGAGHGYFTFWLAGRVGATGKVYANDISRSALAAIGRRCRQEGIGHIETILGEVEDPLFPDGALDMVFIVNAFHDLEKPVELLNNLLPSLKPGATVVIMDRDPEKFSDPSHHFLTKEEILAKIAASRFVLDRMETFLPHHGLYILRPNAPKSDMIS